MSSRPPRNLLLVRPLAQSRALAQRLGVREALVAPVIEIVARPAQPLPPEAGVIVTSANGARLAPALAGRRAWCVGARTAEAVEARGGQVVAVSPDARALVASLTAAPPGLPLIHLAGAHRRGHIVTQLREAGLAAELRVIYDQTALPLAPALIAAIEGEQPALLPLYSPRSARLLGQGVARLGAGLHVIALSADVARAWQEETGGAVELCSHKDGAEMERRIAAALSL